MEKGTVLRNVNNGKVGTVVQYQEKFGHVILEVEGKNVDYNISTIKRWWKPVEDSTPKQEVKEETPVKQNKSETTSTSEPKVSKKPANVSPKQVEEKPKSKKSGSPKTSKGSDVEVFSYIKEQAEKEGFHQACLDSHIYSKFRWYAIGKTTRKDKYICQIMFYVGKSHVKVFINEKTLLANKLMNIPGVTYTPQPHFSPNMSIQFDISQYRQIIPKFLNMKF